MREESLDGPLARSLAELAETPDEAPGLDEHLDRIARLCVDRVAAADYASVTAFRGGASTIVAVTSDLVRALEEVQRDDKEGPCVEALSSGRPSAVADLASTVRWPGFAREALRLGLRATVSVPLFTAGGAAVAALNLHGRDDARMAPLIFGVWDAFDPDQELPAGFGTREPLDDGGRELLAGFTAALTARTRIQAALHLLMERHGETRHDAYLRLTTMAADSGYGLRMLAETVLAGDL
ncbi:GAF and ANTAR domain-containing protein [Actinoplanes sp. DH11]|uniref:GAF and ANTAR domain-containing protein n=1 Tax=Actinoplanes sp. DH11 TaxID=2857011 RepID=UPI001E59123A|nr:GAF and ANTAR domain-containing protein [Actinoplanes sp. DH11]